MYDDFIFVDLLIYSTAEHAQYTEMVKIQLRSVGHKSHKARSENEDSK